MNSSHSAADCGAILVTGGAGFIGSNFVLTALAKGCTVINLDKLTYAGNPENLQSVEGHVNYRFYRGAIGDRPLVRHILETHGVRRIVNFAAESHVDRSIDGPSVFIETNIMGCFSLMDEAMRFWRELGESAFPACRFLQVSTDEVYGSLGPEGYFREDTNYAPNSPYSASKAAADHLVRAYFHTYQLPVLTTNCSNNYGPFQFPEKLIPVIVLKALRGEPIPIYGDGGNIRDWLFVGDHCDAILEVLDKGRPGETYNIGGNQEKTNLDVAHHICALLDELKPGNRPYRDQITFVKDRPGHDRRYAIDAAKIKAQLGWEPKFDFAGGMRETVAWYLANMDWCQRILSGEYRIERQGLG